MKGERVRVLVAKPGFDGHDKGAKVVAQALRDAGIGVIYTGLHQTTDQIVNAAIQEDVDVIGLSILSGAHIPLCEKLLRRLSVTSPARPARSEVHRHTQTLPLPVLPYLTLTPMPDKLLFVDRYT